MKNINLASKERISLQRKGALLSWTTNLNYYYLMEELDISPLLEKRKSLKNREGSFQAMFLRLLAGCAEKHDFFYQVIFGSKVYRRKNLVMSTLVSFEQEIAGSVRIVDPHLQSFDKVRSELSTGRENLREKPNAPWWLDHLPMFLLRGMMAMTFFLMYRLNLWMSFFPLDRDVFGAVIVSNVGTQGSASWIVPCQNKYHAPPCSIVFGKAQDNLLRVTFGFDHRIADGRHSMAFINDVKHALKALSH
jgi:hypothetical protein